MIGVVYFNQGDYSKSINYNNKVLEISDGHMSHIHYYDFFINAPIEIVSDPPTLEALGKHIYMT